MEGFPKKSLKEFIKDTPTEFQQTMKDFIVEVFEETPREISK